MIIFEVVAEYLVVAQLRTSDVLKNGEKRAVCPLGRLRRSFSSSWLFGEQEKARCWCGLVVCGSAVGGGIAILKPCPVRIGSQLSELGGRARRRSC